MPALGAPLDLAKYEARNLRAHILGTAPATPVTGQMYYNSGDNTLYWWDGTQWVSARGGASATPQATTSSQGTIQLAGDLAGTATSPQIAAGVITDAEVASANKDGTAGVASLRTLGSGAQQAAAGNDARFTDSRAPSGTAGGDLSGSYPSPQIATGVIVNADVNAAAAIAYAKLALTASIVNGDIAAGAGIAYGKLNLTTSIVNGDISASAAIAYSKLALSGAITNADLAGSIALSKLATDPLARANHTGTQLAATISDFTTVRDQQRLDQHAAPTAAVPFNGQKITGLADPTAAQDAATKAYVDALSVGLDVKPSVRVLAQTTVTISSPGANIDGVAMVSGDRVVLAGQGGNVTTPHLANGIYVWNGAASAMTRATDADTSAEVNSGMFTFVEEGTSDNTGWVLATNNPITLGTTALQFVQFSGAGQIVDGAALLKTGNTLDVQVDNASIEVNADALRVKAAGITNAMLGGAIDATTKLTGAVPVANGGTGQTTQKPARETGLGAAGYYSSATHGAGTTITITQATHGLRASKGLLVQVQEEATGNVVLPDMSVAANGDVTVNFGASVAANAYRVTVIG